MNAPMSVKRNAGDRRHLSEMIPFFHELPEQAVDAANRLWDRVRGDGYNPIFAIQDFAEELTLLKITPPPRPIVKRWTAGVEAGLIERPSAKPQEQDDQKAQGHPIDAVEHPKAELPIVPVTTEVVAADISIEMFARRMFEDTLARLENDARSTAARLA